MKEQSTTKGFAVLSAAGIMVKVISLLYVPFLQAIIGKVGYGVYSVVYQVFVFIYVLANSGIPVAISKLVSEFVAFGNYKDAIKTFKIARAVLLMLGTVMSLLMMVLAKPISYWTHTPEARLGLMVLAPTILITSVMSAYRGYFQGRGNMTPTAVSQVVEQIINTTFSLLFAALLIGRSLEAGVAGGTVGTTLGAMIACIYLIYSYKKSRKTRMPRTTQSTEIKRLSNKNILRKLIDYSIPMTLCVGLQNAGIIIDAVNIKGRLEVAGFIDSANNIRYALLGQYNTLIYVPITLISALCAAVLPAISGAAALDNRKLVQEKVNYALRLCFMVAVPSAVGLAVLSRPVCILLFRSSEGYELLLYGSIVVVLMSIVQIQTTILQSLGKLYVVTVSLGVGIIAKIMANYFLVSIPWVNINGAVVGNILCYIIPLILINRAIKKSLRIRINFYRNASKPFIASAFMGVVIYIIQFNLETLFHSAPVVLQRVVPFSFSFIIGVFVYCYSLILNGGITKKDFESMTPRILRMMPSFMKSRIR